MVATAEQEILSSSLLFFCLSHSNNNWSHLGSCYQALGDEGPGYLRIKYLLLFGSHVANDHRGQYQQS